MKTIPAIPEMERAWLRRDASYDGVFFPAVRTTGIFCRPSCPARKPKPQNVEYFQTHCDALGAGYRPCKRCRPMDANGRPPQWVQRLLTEVDSAPAARICDADLRSMSIEPTRARRFFNEHYGMTFQKYCRARRLGEALRQVQRGADLSGVALDHGYDSTSGFRDAFSRTFGRTPGRSRGRDRIVSRSLESPVGPLTACANASAVCLLEFGNRRSAKSQMAAIEKRFGCAVVPGESKHLDHLAGELTRYFAGELTQFTVTLDYRGTPFQVSVWKGLLRIPYAKTTSYAQLAQRVGRPGAQRAVGTANGRNPIAIVIPCHRVVNKNGRLGGYGGGLWRKQFLLDLERGGA
ncbi:MAG: methylated-DNA--[protein]-cysteine S-methyltransferase [Planctomycetota bacterium]|nr:methylated-DNA--[protein]-cysteine S-methyltransferase [Planctomycetota bacterium]